MNDYFLTLLEEGNEEKDCVGILTGILLDYLAGEKTEEIRPYVPVCVQMALHSEARNDRLLRIIAEAERWEREDAIISRLLYDLTEDRRERWDGRGVPFGKRGEDISLEARAMAVAVMCQKIPNGSSEEEWRVALMTERGRWLDPELTDVALEHLLIISQIRQKVELQERVDNRTDCPVCAKST